MVNANKTITPQYTNIMRKLLTGLLQFLFLMSPLTLTAQQQHDHFAAYLKHSREIDHTSLGVYGIVPDSIESFFYNKKYGSDKKISLSNIRKYLFSEKEMTDEEVKACDFHQGIHLKLPNFIVTLTLKNKDDLSRHAGLNTYQLILTTYTLQGERIDQKVIATGSYLDFYIGGFTIGDEEFQEVLGISMQTMTITEYDGPQPQPNYKGIVERYRYGMNPQGKITSKLTDRKKARIRLIPRQAYQLNILDTER